MEKSLILELIKNGKSYLNSVNMFENGDYKKSVDEIDDMFERFCNGMTEQEKSEMIMKFTSAQGGLEVAVADEYFKEGFKLGLILGAQNFLD